MEIGFHAERSSLSLQRTMIRFEHARDTVSTILGIGHTRLFN